MAGTSTSPPLVHSLNVLPAWQRIDLIADLHLQASEPHTFEAWANFMQNTQADAVFILGDLFEVWVGDDAVPSDPFLQQCLQVMQSAAQQRAVFFMHGNRDFLISDALLAQHGVTLLPDPSCLHWGPNRWLLSHGDALCLDDTDYQVFRTTCRAAQWQHDFLSRPLHARQALARQMRQDSRAHQAQQTHYADPDTILSLQWLSACQAHTLIHGHTHRPADHHLDNGHRRIVLSDWSLDHEPQRAQVLRVNVNGAHQRLTPSQACA